MRELADALGRLGAEERSEALAYYEEYFNRAGPEREQEVIRELGSPAAVAARILADHAVKEARAEPNNPGKGISALWFVILALLAAPMAFPALGLALALIVALVSVIVAAAGGAIAFFASGIAAFASGFFGLFSAPASALILFGVAFLLWGLCKIVFTVIGATISLLGSAAAWLFGRQKGSYNER